AIWILCVTFCVFLVLRFPVALVLVISSIATLWYLGMPIVVVAQQTLQGINLFSLLAIPFFILTGQLLGAGGLANRIVDFANVFVGRLPGGLSIVNSVACMFFGNLSGSAVADTSAIGSVMIPIMVKKGYSPEYAVGVTISSAIQGVVVPPSHNLVLYSIVASTVIGGISVSKLFMAGIIPGFMLLATLSIVGVIISIKRKYPKGDPVALRQVPAIVFHGFLSLTPAVLILGSIIFGVATATEAGALAVVYSFCLGFFVYRELKPKHLWPVLVRTFRTVLMVFFLIGASGAFGYVMTILRLPDLITQGFLSISDTTWVILLMINILLLILGGPMDMAPMIVILTPILLPVCMKLGMDPIQFGLVLIFNAGMGLLTPPVGTVLFVGCAIGKVSVNAGTKAMMPFFLAMMIALGLITYYPPITMWLAGLVR
ncbi:MAG: TRAP transporter large permease, partial [Deltaproteobacteria bacterium]|nr:TRAP transporter large permease [Deltaproteobacteria bacterium]